MNTPKPDAAVEPPMSDSDPFKHQFWFKPIRVTFSGDNPDAVAYMPHDMFLKVIAAHTEACVREAHAEEIESGECPIHTTEYFKSINKFQLPKTALVVWAETLQKRSESVHSYEAIKTKDELIALARAILADSRE